MDRVWRDYRLSLFVYELTFERPYQTSNILKRTFFDCPQEVYLEYLVLNRQKIGKETVENQRKAQTESERHFLNKLRNLVFNGGDKVQTRGTDLREGKLDNRFSGPYTFFDSSNDIYLRRRE